MRKMKFNRVERIAGSFVLLAIVGTFIAAGAILVRKGIFDRKLSFHTILPSSEAIYAGMPVQMAGVRIGAVDEIDLDPSGKALVEFSVKQKYADRIHIDSRVTLARMSLIGERIFDISTGESESEPAKPGQLIVLQASGDVMNVLNGARAAQIVENVDKLITELTEVAHQVSAKKNAEVLMGNLRATTDMLREAIPGVKKTAGHLPGIVDDLARITTQLSAVTEQLAKKSPTGQTNVAALLDETNILIRALQRNFLVRGLVKDVREEDAQSAQKAQAAHSAPGPDQPRTPASIPSRSE